MKTTARRSADQNRLIAIGVGVSALVHAALFALVTLPAAPAPDASSGAQDARPFDAMLVIDLEVPDTDVAQTDAVAESTVPAAAGAAAPAAGAVTVTVAETPAALEPSAAPTSRSALEVVQVERIATLALAQPIVTADLGDVHALLPAVAPSEATGDELTGHEGHDHSQEGPGFWDRLFGSITVSAGHCPVDGTPLRDAGPFPGAGTGSFTLPRAGGVVTSQGPRIGAPFAGGVRR